MPAPAPVIGTSVGRCLLEARKARGLTISDVAQAIKFSPRQIEAIESDAFDTLPGITFVRGFIRSYSKWLRLDPDALLEMFNKQVPQVAATMQVLQDTGASLPQADGRRNHFGSQSSPLLLISVLLAVVAVVAAYLFWPLGNAGPAPQPLPAPAAAAMPAPPVEQSTAAAPTESVQQTMSDKGESQTEQASQSQPVDPELRQLIFVFDDKAWVEIKDATQRVIFAQNNLPGTRQVVNGKPPFVLVIGNASRVQVLYEDRQVDLQPYTKVDVARLTLE